MFSQIERGVIVAIKNGENLDKYMVSEQASLSIGSEAACEILQISQADLESLLTQGILRYHDWSFDRPDSIDRHSILLIDVLTYLAAHPRS